MKKFQFKLQKLLDYRVHLEREQQDNFSKVLGKYVATENVIKSSLEKRTNILLDSKSFLEKGKLDLFYFRDQALKGLKAKMNTFNVKLNQQAIPLNKERAKLIETIKNKKMIEILKDKAKLAYKKEIDKEEQNELDEFGMTSYILKSF